MVELALVLPLLLLLVLGIFKFGTTFTHYLTLHNAVRAGARQLAIERGQATPCSDAIARVQSVGSTLDGLTVQDPPDFEGPSSSCASLVAGEAATMSASMPCDLVIFGIDFAPGCTLSASATERIE
jgi:hypothetical protein